MQQKDCVNNKNCFKTNRQGYLYAYAWLALVNDIFFYLSLFTL